MLDVTYHCLREWKEKYILGRIGLYFWEFGEKLIELILRILGATEKYFQGAEEFSFRDLGRSMHCFQGSGSTDPPPPSGASVIRLSVSASGLDILKNGWDVTVAAGHTANGNILA